MTQIFISASEIDLNPSLEKERIVAAILRSIEVFKEQGCEPPYVVYLPTSKSAKAVQRKGMPNVKIRLRKPIPSPFWR